MPLPVKLQDVIDAFEMTGNFNSHFLDRRTGEIEIITDEAWSAAENNELISEYPEWERELILKAREIQTTDHFIELPSKHEWRGFKHKALEDIAVEWLEAQGIPFIRGDEIELSTDM